MSEQTADFWFNKFQTISGALSNIINNAYDLNDVPREFHDALVQARLTRRSIEVELTDLRHSTGQDDKDSIRVVNYQLKNALDLVKHYENAGKAEAVAGIRTKLAEIAELICNDETKQESKTQNPAYSPEHQNIAGIVAELAKKGRQQ